MTEGKPLPSGSKFRGNVVYASIPTNLVGLVIVLACLYSILDLTAAQWAWFFGSIAVYTAVISYPNLRLQRSMIEPIVAYLDGRERESQPEKIRREAFARIIDLPRRTALVAAAGWILPTLVVAIVMAVRFEPWGLGESFVLLIAGLAAGFVNGTITMFVSKGLAQPVRDTLTAEIPDAAERRSLIRTLSLRTKVIVCVTGVAIVPVVFSVLLARAESSKAFETFTVVWQQDLLDAVYELASSDAYAQNYELAEQSVLPPGSVRPAAVDVAVVDLDAAGAQAERSPLEAHIRDHVRHQLEAGETMGNSLGLPTGNVFSWRRVDGGRILVAVTPTSELRLEGAGSWVLYGVLVLGALAMASGLAFLIANDVGRTTRALQGEADRMASGDLRQGHVLESEDELGDLSRAFEAMGQSLRSTISRVAAAADRVEATAGEMAAVADSVTKVNASQVTGIREAARSMEAIDRQVKDIADSSQALNISVEESSSTILELGAAGEELNDTATVLSTRVGEVSSSIEQMVASVKQVSENTEALSHAAVETSTSMEEMASSMREVDTSAEETARLSDVVIASAEKGQAKVRQTIEGMNAIREATETAEGVIRTLGQRTKEIGAIVDVIDDVADETNLLALNAAIIAAQAGEHGRAFSVVADEIKDLADRTLASTKEIGNLIASVQEESGNAIGAIERGTQSVAEGVDLSAEAGVSLEEITRASRDSGTRISSIVSAVREQAKAAAHVAELMERVRGGVDEIRAAASEQEKGNEVVYRGAVAMREVAQQVRGTTEEQARGSGRIRESVDGVRDAVEQINSALQEQSAACRSVVEFLEEVSSRTQSNEQSAGRMGDATRALLREAEELREDVHRFRI